MRPARPPDKAQRRKLCRALARAPVADSVRTIYDMRSSDGGSLREQQGASERSSADGEPDARVARVSQSRFPSYSTGAGSSFRGQAPGSSFQGQFPSHKTGGTSFPSYVTGGGGQQFPSYTTGGFPSYVTGRNEPQLQLGSSGLPPFFEKFLLKNSKADMQPLPALERELQDLGLSESKTAVLLSRLSLHGTLIMNSRPIRDLQI